MQASASPAPGHADQLSRDAQPGRAPQPGSTLVSIPTVGEPPVPAAGSHPAPAPRPATGQAAPAPVVRDRSGVWLRNATIGLGLLAAASAAVSFSAQYRMVYAARRLTVIAALEAGIPDAAALIFASLGIALALHGRRAIRARVLNVAAVAASVFMNVIAAAPGWKSLAIWVMPPIAYALASDTVIGVVRAWAIARQRALNTRLADEEVTPLAILGGLMLWLLRLLLAPASTLAGFRGWVLTECPVAPGQRAATRQPFGNLTAQALPPGTPSQPAAPGPRAGTKTATFLALVTERHGPLAAVPLAELSRICTRLAPQAGLNTGAARTALRKAVLTARQEGDPQ